MRDMLHSLGAFHADHFVSLHSLKHSSSITLEQRSTHRLVVFNTSRNSFRLQYSRCFDSSIMHPGSDCVDGQRHKLWESHHELYNDRCDLNEPHRLLHCRTFQRYFRSRYLHSANCVSHAKRWSSVYFFFRHKLVFADSFQCLFRNNFELAILAGANLDDSVCFSSYNCYVNCPSGDRCCKRIAVLNWEMWRRELLNP